jgi:hypothetical protein
MRRRALLAALLVSGSAASVPLFAQLVPVTRCNSAIPCSIPYGLRPSDAAAWTPGGQVGQGNTAMSLSTGIDGGLTPRIDRPPVSEDPVEAAARMYVRRYPAPGGSAAKSTPRPTPRPTPAP